MQTGALFSYAIAIGVSWDSTPVHRDEHSPAASRLLAQHDPICLHRFIMQNGRMQSPGVFSARYFYGRRCKRFTTSLKGIAQLRVWVDVPLPEIAFERCIQLTKQHGTRIGMATLDTLHVASALELEPSGSGPSMTPGEAGAGGGPEGFREFIQVRPVIASRIPL